MTGDIGIFSDNRFVSVLETGRGDWNFGYSTNTVNDGTWHFAVMTYDQQTLRHYLDGILLTEYLDSDPINYDGNGVWFGNQRPGVGGHPYNGLVDDVRVYNRAITASEITALYSAAD